MWPLRLKVFLILQVDVCGRCSLGEALRTEPEFHEQIFPVDAWTKERQEQAMLSQKKQSLLKCFHIHVSLFYFYMYLLLKLKVNFL